MAYAQNLNNYLQYFNSLSIYDQWKLYGIDLLLWLNKTRLQNYLDSRGIRC